ncbi:MAG: hypothetical protein MR606_02755 [Mollicutes bacterium]|nr:hypothetical protein [Mollicutes bacterium]MDD7264343.1 hypothetical protein [bacterium]MDY4979673.1 hypothetical protein [Candidatus Onthovivens sp.]
MVKKLKLLRLFPILFSASCSTNNVIDNELPLPKDLFKEIIEKQNFTVNIKSYITDVNYDVNKYVTENAIYYKSNTTNEQFGFINDIKNKNYYSFKLDDKNKIIPSYVYSLENSKYQDDFYNLNSLKVNQLPLNTYNSQDNYYKITNYSILETFSLYSDLFTSSEDFLTIYPLTGGLKILSKDSALLDITYSYENNLIGKISFTFTDINKTSIPNLNEFLNNGGKAKEMSKDLTNIQSLISKNNYTLSVSYENTLFYNTYFTENYIYREYGQSILDNEDYNYVNNGAFAIKDKKSLKDGLYSFEYKDNKFNNIEKLSINTTSLFDLTITPSFLSYYDVIKTFEENSDQYYNCDYISIDANINKLAATFVGINNQDGVTLMATGLTINDSSILENNIVTLYIFYNYNNQDVYDYYSFTNFGKTKVSFIEDYLNSIE